MRVTLTTGMKAGTVVDLDDDVARAYIASSRATPLEMEGALMSDVQETPEQPANGARSNAPPSELRPEPETR